MRYPKNHTDVNYYVPRRKRKIAGSTMATNLWLVLIHETYPNATILELRQILSNRKLYIFSPEADAVLAAYIKAGYGNHVPDWR